VFCTSNSNPVPLSITTVGGTFTSSPAGLTIDAAAGIIDLTTTAVGTYYITYTTPGPCPGSMIDTITIVNPPTANAGADVSIGCGTATASLDGSGSSIAPSDTYLWTTTTGHIVSGANTTAPVINQAGTYILTVHDTLGLCSSTDTVIVTQTAAPVASFTADPTTGAPPLTVNLSNTSSNATIYSWDFGDGTTSSLTNPSVNYLANGTYTITLTASDTSGCSDTATAIIIVNATYTLIGGTVFTPNGDNVNDVFYFNLTGVAALEGDIFDRWGLKIYTFHAPNEGWDGRTTSGVEVQPGTYYYIIKATGFDGNVHEEKGFITLIR
jgi:gliding motility-associated-like protein